MMTKMEALDARQNEERQVIVNETLTTDQASEKISKGLNKAEVDLNNS